MKELLKKEIKAILYISDGWLVGSSPEVLMNDGIPRDYDIIVSDGNKFQSAIYHLSEKFGNPSVNSCGGLKFKSTEETIDIWVDGLENFLKESNSVGYVYNINKNLLIRKI